MARILRLLWKDDVGMIVSIELLFLFVTLTLGLIAGWSNLRSAVNSEVTEMANALWALDQSYSITEARGCDELSFSAGSQTVDADPLAAITWEIRPPEFDSSIDVDACP
jgi:hypothetical protein